MVIKILVVEDDVTISKLFVKFLKKSGFEAHTAPSAEEAEKILNIEALKKNITPKFYNVALGKYPKSALEYDAWLITGSPKSCYENDEWMIWLKDFIQKAYEAQMPLVGICFGHQIVA